MQSLHDRTIVSLTQLVESGAVSVVSLIQDCLDQIARREPELNAFITVTADQAREEASRADREIAAGRYRGPLHGIPVSVKDLIDLRGFPTTAASRVREGHVAAADAPIVTALRRAGAIIVGKCNLHEFAFGTTSEDSAFGPVRNPHDPSRSPGGSSGGSAAAVAAGMGLASIGTDTGGSVRIPSAACGTVGLKPTYGELSCDGVVPLGRSLDHVGPLARCVSDAWILFSVMVGRSYHPTPQVSHGRQPLRLGVLREYFMDRLDDEIRSRFEGATEKLVRAGADLENVSLPHAGDIAPIYLHTVLAEAAAYHAHTLDTRPQDYTPAVRDRLELGRYVLGEDYVRAMHGRELLRTEVDTALRGRQGLLLPTLPIPAPALGVDSIEVAGVSDSVRTLTLRLTQLFNLTGHPAISIPMGLTSSGLPCGLQLVGRRGFTDDLLAVALSCEQHLAERAEEPA